MKKELLLDSFSHLDESLLERSEAAKRYVPWRDILATAACFAVFAGLIAASFVTGRNVPVATPSAQFATPADAEAAEQEWAAAYTPSQGETDNWDTPPVVGSPAMLPIDAAKELPTVPWVEFYPMDVDARYFPPKNGEVVISIPLREAMEEYGDNARYRVVVDRFQNEQPMDPTGDEIEAEMNRLAAVGIVSAYERFYDHGVQERADFTIHVTRYELEHFPPSADYGYMLFLYAERVPDYETAPETAYSGGVAVDSAPVDTTAVTPPFSDEICGLPPAEDAAP